MKLTLGFDISTSKIGVAALDDHSNIFLSDVIHLEKGTLIQKAVRFYNYLYSITSVKRIIVEEPFLMTSGAGSAFTTAMLLKFNAMCCYGIYNYYNIEPIMVSPMSCRSKMGIKIPRGLKGKEKKKIIIDFIKTRFGDKFEYELTKFGNPVPGVDDRADALLLALYGLQTI